MKQISSLQSFENQIRQNFKELSNNNIYLLDDIFIEALFQFGIINFQLNEKQQPEYCLTNAGKKILYLLNQNKNYFYEINLLISYIILTEYIECDTPIFNKKKIYEAVTSATIEIYEFYLYLV